MAANVEFGPSLFIGGAPPSAFGGRVATAPSVERARAEPRSSPLPRIPGDGSLRFPAASGVGLFQPALIQLSVAPSNFIDQAESELPAVISLRGANVNVTV